MEEQYFSFDMRPKAGILNVFSRLNYKPQYAIGEFVDNSTQSYLLHKDELNAAEDDYCLQIDIEYDSAAMTLTVTDNAFGMERDRFQDAIKLDAKNDDQHNSRNEFGMGLKTAASWFGSVWSVSSTQLGSTNRYKATVDIPYLQESGESDVRIRIIDEPEYTHGTEIRIENLSKKLAGRSIGKVKELLGSMYRRDLASGKTIITFNGQEIEFSELSILHFRDRTWKKELDFQFDFDQSAFRVTGFVAIMEPGSFAKSGFALFRRDRVVIGGTDENYRPKEIFGKPGSEINLRLFGELDLDDFPINQAKDGFIWADGLEDAFIEALKNEIDDFRKVASLTKKARAEEEELAHPASQSVEKAVSEAVDRLNSFVDPGENESDKLHDEDTTSGFVRDYQAMLEAQKEAPDTFSNEIREYTVRVSSSEEKNVSVRWAIGNGTRWIGIQYPDESSIFITIDINHPFFKPYSRDSDFKAVLESFVIAFVVSEEQAKLNSTKDGMVVASSIRNNMNRILSAMAGGPNE